MKNPEEKFSIKKRLLSFKYAFRGITFLIKTQHNAWIHLLATILVLFAGFWFSITATEWILVILAIGLVLAAEAFNTAIELLVDKISPGFNEQAGRIKDVAAGAVLLTAIAAAVVGIIVFGPKVGI